MRDEKREKKNNVWCIIEVLGEESEDRLGLDDELEVEGRKGDGKHKQNIRSRGG